MNSSRLYIHMKNTSMLVSSALFAAAMSSNAAIIANFTDGAGTTMPDQYAGVAGSGWLGAWGTNNSPTVAVASATPVNGGGNYLNVTTSITNDAAVGRRFDGTATGANIALPVTFTFDLRINTLSGWDSTNDYISVHSNTSLSTYNVGTDSTFFIRALGASPATGINANQWLFYNGAANGTYSAANFQSSGMAITEGTTYTFNITNDPVAKKYSVSIFDGTSTVSASDLGWRSSTASNSIAFNQKVSAGTDVIGYSIDNISIIPESATTMLLGLAGLAMLRRRRAD